MIFLYPVFLWALAGISIPFLIHLFGRKKAKPVRFSSLLFLKASSTKTGKMHKVEEILILLFRAIFLLFLLLFLAGPLSKSFLKFKKTTNDLFIIDDSYSMSAKSNPTPFKETKICAEKILSSLKNPSEVGMIFLSGRDVPFTRNFSKIKNIIEKSSVSYYSGNLEQAITRINKMCSGIKGSINVYFFTDMKKYTWERFSPSWTNQNIRLIIVDTGGNKDNNLSIESIHKIPGKNEFSCKIINWGRKKVSAEVVFHAGKQQTAKTISIPGKNSVHILTQVPPDTSAIEAKLITPDLISDDNSFFLSLAGNKNKKILVAGDNAQDIFYVQSAIESEINPSYKVTTSSTSALNSDKLDRYSMIFLINPGISETKMPENLNRFMNNGGNVVFFAGNKISSDIFNRYWYVPVKKSSFMPVQFTRSIMFKTGRKIIWVETENPVFRRFGNNVLQYLRTVYFYKSHDVKNVSGEILTELQGNIPLIIEKNEGKGTLFFCNFSPDLSWTNFPKKPFFPVLINNLVSYSLENTSFLAHPGDAILLPWNKNSTKVYSPSGKEWKTLETSKGTIYFIPDSPGFWTVRTFKNGSMKEQIFSVNCNWKAGNPEKISINKIKKIMAGTPVLYVNAAHINTFVAQQQYSSNLSILFLIIAFIFFIGEVIASNLFHNRKVGHK